MERTASAGIEARVWSELLALAGQEGGDRAFLERLLEVWRREHGAEAAGLYREHAGTLEKEAAVGPGLPEAVEAQAPRPDLGSFALPGGRLLFLPAGLRTARAADPLAVAMAAALRNCRLKQDLKEQQFQVNYRVVELEALYDVGLAIAATLDLDRLSEEVLLRAVSLLDARRGALYLLENGRYRLDRTLGGEAARWFPGDDPVLRSCLADEGDAPAGLLPGARYLLAVPILGDEGPRGLLVVGDKESRRGVGPFPPSDRRTLSLFANQAAIALENARLHLEALEKERLDREMQLAAEIQRQILPKGAPQVPGWQLIGWNRPARQVGGDYYDLFHRRDGHIGLVVGDVSGKGIPASLMVSTLHSALRLLLDQSGFGADLLERLNRHILESSMPNRFITMLLAELDPRTGLLRYGNAGHNSGLLLRRGDGLEELPSGGVPLGLLPNSRFESRELTLEPGDLLCLFSDGITEAVDALDLEFGEERLVEVLRKQRNEPLQAVLEAIQRAVAEHSGGLPQGDDQTLVLVRRDS